MIREVKPLSLSIFERMIPPDSECYVGDKPVSYAAWREATTGFRDGLRRMEALTILDERGRFLEGKTEWVYSQFGEDGLIASLFEKIGKRNRWCFEVGAHDGKTNSNTKLLRDQGWHSVLIEGDRDLFLKLSECEMHSTKSNIYLRQIGPRSLDSLLAHAQAPLDLDLGVIDIDSADYHVFDGLRFYRPRVMLVEFSLHDDPPPPIDGPGQAGVTAIVELGRSKGYVPLCCTYVNCLFALEECL